MAEIRVPTLGELVTEATIGKWFKKAGDVVAVDEPLVELETDKVTIEVPAPAAGVLTDVAAKDGDTVAVGALLGAIKEGAGRRACRPARSEDRASKPIDAGPQPKPERRPLAAAQAEAGCGAGRRHAARALGAQDRRRDRHRCRDRARHRQGRPRHQGRHARRDRARGRAADAGRGSRPPRCRSARRRPPTTPRAKSACG